MTTADKLTMLKSLLEITDTTQDTALGVYLTIAKKELVSWRYGYSSYPNIAKAVNSEDNDVKVSASLFIEKLNPTSGTTYTFTYSESAESWQYASADVELGEYGLTYDADPINAETIAVKYNENYLAEYDMVQVMSCVVGYGLIGAEGQTSHSENGIGRSFKYSEMLEYIHKNVIPYVKVV